MEKKNVAILSGSLNLSAIDKPKIVKGKDGNQYLNITMMIQDKSQYGNNIWITQSQTQEEREAIERMLQLQYSGTNNAGNLMYIDVDSPENAPRIEPIPTNNTDGYYTTINDMVIQRILTGHRITSPMILGIKTPGQLGGRDEVVDAYLLLVNTVIRPFQQDILQVIDDLLEYMYPELEITVGVQQLKLFTDGSEDVDVVTSIDAEVGDDAELEAEIETADKEAGVNEDEPITELPLA